MPGSALFLVPPSRHAKNVARDLVYGCWCKGRRIAGIQFPPMSLLLVATVVRDSGVPVELLDAGAAGLTVEQVAERAGNHCAVVVLTSNMTYNEDAEVLAAMKRRNPALVSMVFGGFVTALPEAALARPSVDVVVRREAERIVRNLVLALLKGDDWRNVKGISFRDGGRCVHNPDEDFLEDLDELPIPDRRLLLANADYFNPVVKRMPFTTMFTSRGCPGLCTFCSSPTFYGRQIRYRSAASVLREIEEVVRLGYREIFFRDEIFTVSKQRVRDVCQGILDRGCDVTWICSARIGSVDRDTMQLMKKAGCHMLRVGVESGVQQLLDNVKKGIRVEQTEETFRWAHEVGLDTHAHMMLGLPGESRATFEQSLAFALRIDPTVVTMGIMTAYAGTPLYEELRRLYPEIGDTTQADLSRLHTEGFLNEKFTSLTNTELSECIRRFYRRFYLRPSYVWKWLRRIRSVDELKRVTLAATQVFEFAVGQKG